MKKLTVQNVHKMCYEFPTSILRNSLKIKYKTSSCKLVFTTSSRYSLIETEDYYELTYFPNITFEKVLILLLEMGCQIYIDEKKLNKIEE